MANPKTRLRLPIRVGLYTCALGTVFALFYTTLFAKTTASNSTNEDTTAVVYAMNGEPTRVSSSNSTNKNNSDASNGSSLENDEKLAYVSSSNNEQSIGDVQNSENVGGQESVKDENVDSTSMSEGNLDENSSSEVDEPALPQEESESDSTSASDLDASEENAAQGTDYGYPVVAKSDDAITKTILIDVGHGGTDLGDASKDGVIEKNVTLDLALKLKKHLETQNPNLNVVLTREDDATTHGTSSWEDLTWRRNKQEDVNPDYYLSLHAHSDDSDSATFYINPDDPQTEILTTLMAQNLANAGWTTPSNTITTDTYPLQLISMANSHAAMLELGSLKSSTSLKLFKDSETMEKTAAALANAISTTILNNPDAPAYSSVQKQLAQKVNSSL